MSPVMFNAAFKTLKIKAEYKAYEIEEGNLDDFMKIVRSDFAGLSVSLPYKEKVMRYLDKINKDAGRIGAVNTIINHEGYLFGFNTDYLASNKALFMSITGYKILRKDPIAVVIGAGGAARAVCYGLLKMGIHVWIANRTKIKADRIAMEFAEMFRNSEIHSVPLENIETGDILINTTSIWIQNPDIGALDLPYFCKPEYVKEFQLVMDICYKPLETPLIKVVKRLKKPYVTGDKMLLYQAADQFELWTGKEPPVEVMKDALRHQNFGG